MADRYLKRCSASLVIQEMQIKSTMSYYFTTLRMTEMKKSEHTVLGGLEGSGILSHWNAASTLKVVLEFWQKAKHVLNNLLHYMSDIPLSGIAQE